MSGSDHRVFICIQNGQSNIDFFKIAPDLGKYNCQHRLTFSPLIGPSEHGFFLFFRGDEVISMRLARFLMNDPLLWQECTVPVIRSAPCFTGCSSITLTSSFKNMSPVSRRSTASSAPSSRRWSSASSTAATPAAGLPGFAVLTVVRNFSSTSPVALAAFAHRAIRRGGRNGPSGCGRHSFWMSPTARSSSPSPKCSASSSNTTAGFWEIFAVRLLMLSLNTSRQQPAQS